MSLSYDMHDVESPYDKVIIEIDNDTAFVGFCLDGTKRSERGWKIKKLFKSGSNTIWRWAKTDANTKDGKQLNKILNDYASYYYESN